ncbi:hypothetical protein BASA60_009426 [Batrachochytrium salamandrivorans]|nr:hypothetical protein BASA60_009426 [Batrachochytrium salamandrivorans]
MGSSSSNLCTSTICFHHYCRQAAAILPASNSIDINIATSAFHVRDYLRQTAVALSDGVARVYSNSTMQLDNNSLPEIAVGMGCTNKSVDTNEVPTNTNCVSNTMTATTAILPGGVARVNSSSPTRLDSSSLPAIVVETECVGKRMVTSRVRVRKPRGGKSMTAAASVLVDGAAGIYSDDSTRPGDTILSEIVVDTGCTGNSIERIATPESTAIVSPLLSRLKSRPLKKSRKSTTRLEKGWKASLEHQWPVYIRMQFKPDDTISDSLLLAFHGHYLKQ